MRASARILLLGMSLLAACTASGSRVDIRTTAGTVTFQVELALTEAQQTQGLMYRNELAANRGMLFVFHEDEDRAFWMKNTLIPLDMVFIAASGEIVGIRENTTPLSLAGVSVGRPSRYVLEIAGGQAAKQGIRTGDPVTMHGVPHG
jgi:uncharacterized protein